MRSIFPCTVIFSFCLFNLVVSLRTETLVNIRSPTQLDHASKDLNSLIESKGYHQEIHHIITRDGYILGTFRIRKSKFLEDQPTVVLLHSWLQSHVVFLMGENGIKSSKDTAINNSGGLAFDLADHGFDVWLLNLRGNYYSTNHTTYKPQKDEKFWKFSLQDMALKDIPDSLDLIQKITRSETIGFIGLGQGATLALWLLAERPSYARLLRPLILLNPWIDANQIRIYVKFLNSNYVQSILGSMTGPLLNRNAALEQFVSQYCSTNIPSYQCANFYDQIGVRGSNPSMTGELAKYFPSGTSFRVGHHQAQILNQNDLTFYDGGIRWNLCKYKQFNAPKIKWNQINSKDIVVFAVSNEVRTSNGRLIVFGQELQDKLLAFEKFGVGQYTTLDILLNRDLKSSVLDETTELKSKYRQVTPQTTVDSDENRTVQRPNVILRIHHPPIVPTSVPPQNVLPPPPSPDPSTTNSSNHSDLTLNIIENPSTTPAPPAVTPKPRRLKVLITKDGFE